MLSSQVRDIKSLKVSKMFLYLLLTALQLSCCSGASIKQALREIKEVKHIFPKQASNGTNQTVVCCPALRARHRN